MAARTAAAMAALALAACTDGGGQAWRAPPPAPVRITMFYASPPNPARGERSLVCYGTQNATAVRMDPPGPEVWPSPSRCLEVAPKQSTTYTITAERGAERVSRSLTITPGPPRAEIVEVRIDAREVPRGTPMTVCYTARNAASVTVTPGTWFLVSPTPERGCVRHVIQEATTFQVRARNAAGEIVDGEDVEVRVK